MSSAAVMIGALRVKETINTCKYIGSIDSISLNQDIISSAFTVVVCPLVADVEKETSVPGISRTEGEPVKKRLRNSDIGMCQMLRPITPTLGIAHRFISNL